MCKKIKVLHISTSDFGGAGLAAKRLHCALSETSDIESKMLVLHKQSMEHGIESFLLNKEGRKKTLLRIVEKAHNRFSFSSRKRKKYLELKNRVSQKYPYFFTSPLSDYDLTSHPLVLDADIIHLHWIAGFLDFPSFFKKITKPIVWTFRDENIGLGGFHYNFTKDKFYDQYRYLEDEFLKIKRNAVENYENITAISLSKMMFNYLEKVPFLKAKRNHIIHNPVDTDVFRPVNKVFSRELFKLPKDKKIILFVSQDLDDERKGLSFLIKALDELNINDVMLCAVGRCGKKSITKIDSCFLGQINDERLLVAAYSSADLFVMPSFQ